MEMHKIFRPLDPADVSKALPVLEEKTMHLSKDVVQSIKDHVEQALARLEQRH